ncbi:MAG: hydrogenase nickel incorporation protein HypB [Thermocrinis sp.]|nr:hydrogenase nickel incorporation protein HypB [Thermocrinis sp.]
MCKECGCGEVNHVTDRKVVQALTKVLDANDRQAQENREHFEKHGVYAINLMSSPGAGKTSLIEATVEALKDQVRIGVIEGDLETDLDAQRIKNKGAPAYQITTGGACHLDAFMVHEGIHNLPLENLDVVFIENVGNLVCPASYDVGAHMNVVLLAVTEGDDKPEKYPVMFRSADLLVITKTDLLPYVDFSIERAVKSARKIKPNIDFIALSCKTKEGLEDWLEYIKLKVRIAKKSFMV